MLKALISLLLIFILYLTLWPVPIDPVSWQSPANPGYTGEFALNEALEDVERLPLVSWHGPEDIALDAKGIIYASTGEGAILRIQSDFKTIEHWLDTDGRPLGIEFDASGNLIVADAYRGLLSIAPSGQISVLTDEVEGSPILYADDLDITKDGVIYFSDASTKFGAEASGGTLEGSMLDVLEHGGHGRLLSYDPKTGITRVEAEGIDFANGIAISHDGRSVLINETGHYRVLRYWIEGEKKGTVEVVISELPGFPDNLARGINGSYWVGLIAPRIEVLDATSDKPFLRRLVQRLPAFMRPKVIPHGHVIAIDETGRVVENLQDTDTAYSHTTGVTETAEYLYISSLKADSIARLKR